MMKTYVTFGQIHTHSINGKTFDKDCVAVINCINDVHGRKLAFEFFGPHFCFEVPEEHWKEKDMKFFPRGYIEVNPIGGEDDQTRRSTTGT